MAKQKSKLNDRKSKFIEENILLQNPEGLPDKVGLVVAKEIPEMRNVMFLNGRDPGYPLEFHYHSKTHPLKHYKLLHGFEYCLPVEIIDHLEGCREHQYAYRTGLDGHPEMYTKSYKYIFTMKNAKKAA